MHTLPPHNYTYTDVMLVDREAAISVYVPAGGWGAPKGSSRSLAALPLVDYLPQRQ